MWFKKLSLKAAAVVLAGFASSAFSQALAPLQITADDWNYLSNFKLFGQTGLSFGNQDEFPNEAGWVGTATGDLYSTGNNGKVGGAIIVGGTIHPHSNMQFTTGPIRYGTGFTSGVYNGSVRCDGLTTSGSCKDVPLYRTNLKVPSAGTISGMTQSVPDRSDLKIEMPYKGSYDIYFSSLTLGAEAALIIELPDKKHAARLFINKLNVNNHPMFLVKYKDENGYRCIAPNNKFQLSGRQAECVGDYEGNLVVYVNHSIKFGNTDNYPMDGTFIFNGTAEFVSNFMFSGQIFAKELKLGSDINGKNFKFVKYVDPPKIILSQKNATFKEGTSWYEIGIGLDSDEGEKDVTFDYCFEFQGSDIPGKFAIPADVDVSGTGHDFPICGKATGHVTIPKGKTVAQNDANRIFIKPIIDGFVEESSDGEKLWLKVTNVQGAEVSSVNYDAAHGFNVFITDVDKIPSVSSSLVINVNEDDKHSFTKAEFKFEHNVVDRPKEDFKSVVITGLPSAGSLTLNGTAVTRDQEIAVGSLGKLVYTPKANEFGNNYATFKYKVVRSGAGDDASIQSKEYTATVNVIPVNDKPSVADVVFVVNELDHTVTGGPISVSDVSINKGKELGVDEYNYDLVNVSGSDFAAFKNVFEIVPSNKGANATIKVIGALDYSVKKEYVVYATVTDNAATETTKIAGPLTSEQFKITVKIANENDDPVINDQTFTIAEKQADGSDWPSGKTVGDVKASDVDGDVLSFSVAPSEDVPFKFSNGTKTLVVSDGSRLDYETKTSWKFKVIVSDGQGGDATAQITVNLTDVNEPPPPPVVKREYSVEENKAKGTVVGTFEAFDGDKISGSYETLTYTLEGSLTGAAAASTTLKNKTMADIFELVETNNNAGTRTVSIRVKDQALLDYEALYNGSNATYPVNITVTDSKGHSTDPVTTRIAVIDVNEEPWAKDGYFYVLEHSISGTQVCVEYDADQNCIKYAPVNAGDKDLYSASFSDLRYSINTTVSTQNTQKMVDASKNFTINPTTGRIYTSNTANFLFDALCDQCNIYEFMVTVSDGEFSANARIFVEVLDVEEPQVINYVEGTKTVPENSDETVIIDRFNKEDLSEEDQKKFNSLTNIVYTLENISDPKFKDLFEISSRGTITPKNGVELDYEALYTGSATAPGNDVDIKIMATENGCSNCDKVYIVKHIAVTDVNEPSVFKEYGPYSVNEDLAEERSVGFIKADDPDFCSAKKPCGNGTHPSGFNKLHFFVDEVKEVNGSKDFPFDLNEANGEITLKKGEKLNFTKQNEYRFVVRVRDSSVDPEDPPITVKHDVVIKVVDVNRAPEFKVLSDLYKVEEMVNVGTVLVGDKIVVYDEDQADIDELKISISENNPGKVAAKDLFEVVKVADTDAKLQTTFVIKTKDDIDYEELYNTSLKDAIFDVSLTITDTDGNKTSKNTQIRITDKNEEPTVVKPNPFTIAENTTKATMLGKIEAYDPDKYNPNFGTLYFSLEGDEATQFDIDVSSGELFTINNAKFDYETKSTYQFKAVITDKEYTKKVDVVVNITNKSEPPTFSDKSPKLDVDENTSKGDKVTIVYVLKDGTKVGSIVADDDDCKGSFKSTCKLPTYSLTATDIAASDYKAFNIDNDGNITVAADNSLNYEKKKEYSVRIVATDGSDATLSNFIDVVIKINDVNDAPTYEKKDYVFEIHENAPKGEFIGTVVADDEDTWSKLTFALSDAVDGSGDNATFYIDDDGSIFLATKTLNYEKKKEYKVVATATDNGKDKGFDNYTAQTNVTIKVIDDPDTPTIKDDGKPGYDVAENTVDNNTPTGFEIACYEVSDEDEGQVETLNAYVKDVGNTDADRLFGAKIKKDGSTYKVCLIVKDGDRLNYEAIEHVHNVIVAVMDADKLTAEVTKKLNLTDVNEMPVIMGNPTFSFYDRNKVGDVVGKLYPDDIDTSKAFIDNVFSVVGGDTDAFEITEDGKIKAKKVFDFQNDAKLTYTLDVALSDRDNKTYPKLTTQKTITITIKNRPKAPEITSKEFKVKENSDGGTPIGVIEAKDPDGDDKQLLFELSDDNPYVIVTQEGEIKVKDGAEIDFEKMQEFTISVTVTDIDGMYTDGDIVIKVVDVNEAPKITPQEFTFPEDSKPGTKKGPIEAKDPDTKNPDFNDLKFYPVDENEKFEIKTNGDIVLKGELDYEKDKSYVIKVYVTDGEFNDTTEITVNVGNVVEKSEVEITRVEAGDSVYLNPKKEDIIYTNKEVILVEWKQDGKTKSSLDTLKEGCQQIIKTFKDPSKDIAGADTIEVCYSTASPVVDVFAPKTKVTADNIFTVVETVDKKDSSIYVNEKDKDVKVTVKDTVSGYTETFNVTVVLDTVAVPDKAVKTLIDVSKSQPSLDKNPKSGVSTTPVNDNKTVVSYKETVDGHDIVISYNVDNNGDIIKVPVIGEDGQKKMTEVIEVSTTVEVKGKSVVVSYKADAETGKMLYGDSEGNLMVDVPSTSSSKPTSSSSKKGDSSSSSKKDDSKDGDEVDLKTGVGAFTVTYDAKGVEGNKATVSYVIDEKGKIVANDEGDRGYLVTYTYTNKYGNSADKSVFMVLDKVKPFVKILSPSENDVIYANYVDVDWCISIDGDKDNCVKQDTLNFESLHKGVNTIKRIYRDKAGNEMVAEVSVMMKKAKDVNIDLEKPMILVSIDSVDKYYSSNPPEEDQSYAVSILNPTTHKEKEVVKGFDGDTKKGSGDEPYPGFDGHIGPTLKIDLKLPVATSVGGLATLDDIIINGDMVVLDEVDAADAEKVTVKEYVKEYCSDEFQKEFKSLKDYSKATLYESKAHVKLWFYTTGGQFIDKFSFDYDVDDPDYVDKAGLVKFFFEMKPDMNGELRDTRGRLYGTGPFIVKTNVDIRSKLRCVVPPINENSNKIGDVLKSSDELLTRFGYRRPVLHGNERPLQNTKKSSSKSSSKSSKKK